MEYWKNKKDLVFRAHRNQFNRVDRKGFILTFSGTVSIKAAPLRNFIFQNPTGHCPPATTYTRTYIYSDTSRDSRGSWLINCLWKYNPCVECN